jgi:hypothetical protein
MVQADYRWVLKDFSDSPDLQKFIDGEAGSLLQQQQNHCFLNSHYRNRGVI